MLARTALFYVSQKWSYRGVSLTRYEKLAMSIISPDSLIMAWAASGLLDVSEFAHLISVGASLHCVDERGRTPLLLAVIGGHVDTVRYLVDLGADVSCRDTDDRDPVSYARNPLMLRALGLDHDDRSTSVIEVGCADLKLA